MTPGPTTEVDLGIQIVLGMRDLARHLARAGLPPDVVPLQGSVTGQNNKQIGAVMGGPAGGREWHIRRLSFAPPISGISGGVSQAGTFCIGKAPSLSLGAAGVVNDASQWVEVVRTTTVPNMLDFSTSEFVVRWPFQVVAIWVSGVGTLLIDGDAEDIPSGNQYPQEA